MCVDIALSSSSLIKVFFFIAEGVDGETLLMLNDSDIQEMGFRVGPKLKLRAFISSLKQVESVQERSSPPPQANSNAATSSAVLMSSKHPESAVMDYADTIENSSQDQSTPSVSSSSVT